MNELKHVAIIMDGNGRWAKERGLNRSKGHKEGSVTLEKLCTHILKSEVEVLSVYAFSTENFKRDIKEVNYLMNLFIKMFSNLKTIQDNNIKLVFSGSRNNLSNKLLKVMDKAVEATKNNTNGILNVCLNYGGQLEIVDAVKKIMSGKVNINDINETVISKYLYNDLPPIDLMIRTSGEKRLSNFMLYQLAYSELYFTDTYFPDFLENEYEKAVNYYYKRDRRFGGIKNEN